MSVDPSKITKVLKAREPLFLDDDEYGYLACCSNAMGPEAFNSMHILFAKEWNADNRTVCL
jgi:hypothetical protein